MAKTAANKPSVRGHRRDWEELAEYDAMWAIISDPAKRGRHWDEQEFFATGEREIERLVADLDRHSMSAGPGEALDFGCGYGRLTRALGRRVGSAVGVDISSAMVEGAKRLNAGEPTEFVANEASDLGIFEDGRFDVIYSVIVLQHVPSEPEILKYVSEFVRVLKPGGSAVFQIPSRIATRYRLQPVARAYRALRAVGVPASFLLEKMKLQPMRMTAVSEAKVRRCVEAAGGQIVAAEEETQPTGSRSVLYFVTR